MRSSGIKEFKSLAQELRRLRKSHRAAAKSIGITPEYFSYCLNGHVRPSQRLIELVAEKRAQWSRLEPRELDLP